MLSLLSHVKSDEGSAVSTPRANLHTNRTASTSSIWRNVTQAVSMFQEATYNLYLITIDDTPTFIVPNTVFGIASALTPSFILSSGTISLVHSLCSSSGRGIQLDKPTHFRSREPTLLGWRRSVEQTMATNSEQENV